MKEDQNKEWKESWRDEYLKALCGFANAEGGCLIVGRNDNGQVVGVSNADRLMEDLPNKIRDLLGIMPAVKLRKSAGKVTVEIVVDAYPHPVSYHGRYYQRRGCTTQELKGAALDRFLLGKQGKHWDGVPVPHLKVSELNRRVLADFRKRAADSKRMRSTDLKVGDTTLIDKLKLREGRLLKRAAALLFHSDPEDFVTGAYIKIGFFAGPGDIRFQDEIHGDLFTQADGTIDLLLTKYTAAAIDFRGRQRVETYPVPEDALREAVHNAIIHKDYASGTPIQISVYRDKIMLWNPGHLPPELTPARLFRKHPSLPANPDVANAFFRAGMIEAWGDGYERIVDACYATGNAKPKVRCEAEGIWLEFAFPKEYLARVQSAEQQKAPGTGSGKGRAKVGEKVGEPPDDGSPQRSPKRSPKTENRILDLIVEDNTISTERMGEILGISKRAVLKQTRKLQEQERLTRIGPARGGHWEVLEQDS
jgi:ATP-dependent DNA helicase RecG